MFDMEMYLLRIGISSVVSPQFKVIRKVYTNFNAEVTLKPIFHSIIFNGSK